MEGEIVRSEPQMMSRRAQLTRAVLDEEIEQRQLLGEYVQKMMKKDVDYGIIPGTPKPTLLKPGAEKLIDLFRCTPEFSLVPEFCREDFATGFFKYTFRCRILSRDSGAVLAEGFGSANSREEKHRWRNAPRKCPACGSQEALLKSKDKPEYFCWKKKNGCGETFPDTDSRITGQVVGKIENPAIADLDNTILKMAKKRAQVDGAIALARCSDMFTQDVEDFAGGHEEPARPTPPESSPTTQTEQPAPKKSKQEKKPAALLTREEAEKLDRMKELVGFDRWKSTKIAELKDDELGEAYDFGAGKVEELSKPDHPQHWTLNAVKNRVMLLAIEYETREKRAGTFPAALEGP